MPAPVDAWISTCPVAAAALESLLYTYAPWRPLCALARYVNAPWLVWYVCGLEFTVEQIAALGLIGYASGAHPSTAPLMAGMSGRPVTAPAWSGQFTMSSTLVSAVVLVPIIAR